MSPMTEEEIAMAHVKEENLELRTELTHLKAHIQTCKKASHKYYAQSLEYPCPWCMAIKQRFQARRRFQTRR